MSFLWSHPPCFLRHSLSLGPEGCQLGKAGGPVRPRGSVLGLLSLLPPWDYKPLQRGWLFQKVLEFELRSLWLHGQRFINWATFSVSVPHYHRRLVLLVLTTLGYLLGLYTIHPFPYLLPNFSIGLCLSSLLPSNKNSKHSTQSRVSDSTASHKGSPASGALQTPLGLSDLNPQADAVSGVCFYKGEMSVQTPRPTQLSSRVYGELICSETFK